MGMTMRVSLPGYDAGTDTNLDHFALHADADNALIKEYTRGIGTISAGGTQTIAHNLGYVPFFLSYVQILGNTSGTWQLVPSYINNGVSVPPQLATSDTGTLYLTNNEGASRIFKWYIFYDNFTANAGTITSSAESVRVSMQGIDVLTSTDPNSYIFHSDLNTFKIIKEGTLNISYTGTSSAVYSFAHNLGSPSSYFVFMKFPDGKTALLPGQGAVFSYDSNWNVSQTTIDGTNISMRIQGTGNATLPVKYYIFEPPL